MLDINKYIEIGKRHLTRRSCSFSDSEIDNKMTRMITMMSRNGYIFDDPQMIKAVEQYARGYSLMLVGGVGTGKSFFFTTLPYDTITLDMNEAVRWDFSSLDEFLKSTHKIDLVIDDLGVSSGISSDYGLKYDALLLILNRREKSKCRTHFTTNLSNEQLINAFDYRVVDRIYGMAQAIVLSPRESRRTPRNINLLD